MVAGFHVEGPNIGPEDGPRGAHPAAWVRPPSTDEFQRWQDAAEGRIRLITVSPHWQESARYIEWVVKQGIAVSIGHTSATPQHIRDAASAGATLSTHLGNAAPATIDRRSNLFWTQLADDRLSASFIVDGFHLDDSFLRAALRAKRPSRSVLVTDASAPAGAMPGSYKLGAQPVDLLADGRIVLSGTRKLAGSALSMNNAIANAVRLGGVTLEEAIAMATTNPRRIIGLADSGDKVTLRHTNTGIEIDDVLIGTPLQ
jgi:N-acetylglucosamine-6-phosphate deacetylase